MMGLATASSSFWCSWISSFEALSPVSRNLMTSSTLASREALSSAENLSAFSLRVFLRP